MEYCITVLVEAFQPSSAFRLPQPVETAWGSAFRASEEDKLFWADDLYVQRQKPVPHLYRFLPAELQNLNWIFLKIDGSGLNKFELDVNTNRLENVESFSRQESLLLLFEELLSAQALWAVFLEKDCDQITEVLEQSLPEFIQSIVDAYRWDANTAKGFCSVSHQYRSVLQTTPNTFD